MKKYFLAGVMVLSIFATQLAYAATPVVQGNNVFTDVTPNSEYYNALLYLKNQGVIDGYPDGSFKPNNTINRAEFTKIVVGASPDYVANNSDYCMEMDGTYPDSFKDVLHKDHPWYENYLCFAKSRNWIGGYPDGTFRPDQNINFVEAAKILDNAFGIASEGESGPWYKVYVDLLAFQKAIPTTITTFNQNITRGEMAEMAFRLKSQNTSLPSQTYNDLR